MVSAVVMSGGQSTRMGQEKGLMQFCGRKLVEFVLETVSQVADDVIVSVAKGKSAEYIEALGPGLRIVEDRETGQGPMEGLVCAFGDSRSEYVLVVPCDTPFLTVGVCNMLIAYSSGHDGSVPRVRGFLEPLHAVYSRDSGLRAFKRTLGEGHRKLLDAFEYLDLAEVNEATFRKVDPDLSSFWNLNTKEDIALAEQKMKPQARGT